MTSAQEAPPQAVSAALFESVKIIFMSLKKQTNNLLCCGVS